MGPAECVLAQPGRVTQFGHEPRQLYRIASLHGLANLQDWPGHLRNLRPFAHR